MIIAVDAAGGEYAPHEIVKGAIKAAHDYGISIALIGRKDLLHVQVGRHRKNLDISLVDASQTIKDHESPVEAVNNKPDSSIMVGVNMVKLESYIVDASFTVAQFYAEIEGHPAQREVDHAFQELQYFCARLKILGTYLANSFRDQA